MPLYFYFLFVCIRNLFNCRYIFFSFKDWFLANFLIISLFSVFNYWLLILSISFLTLTALFLNCSLIWCLSLLLTSNTHLDQSLDDILLINFSIFMCFFPLGNQSIISIHNHQIGSIFQLSFAKNRPLVPIFEDKSKYNQILIQIPFPSKFQ